MLPPAVISYKALGASSGRLPDGTEAVGHTRRLPIGCPLAPALHG